MLVKLNLIKIKYTFPKIAANINSISRSLKLMRKIDFVSMFASNGNVSSQIQGHFTLSQIDDKSDVIEQCIIYPLQGLFTQTKSEPVL